MIKLRISRAGQPLIDRFISAGLEAYPGSFFDKGINKGKPSSVVVEGSKARIAAVIGREDYLRWSNNCRPGKKLVEVAFCPGAPQDKGVRLMYRHSNDSYFVTVTETLEKCTEQLKNWVSRGAKDCTPPLSSVIDQYGKILSNW